MNYRKEDLRPSLIISTCLHVGMMCALYFGLPNFFEPPPVMSWKPVPIDIVDIGAITNTRIKKNKPKPPKAAPKKKKAPVKKVEPIKKPEPPKPSVKEAPKPEKLKPEEVVFPTKEKVKKKKAKKKKPKPKAKPQIDPLASVLKNVAKLKASIPTPEEVRKAVKQKDGDKNDNEISHKGPALSDRLTISQEDSLRRQISSCWNMPIGAQHAENLIVEVLIEVNQDRTVREAEVVDQMRMSTDSYFRAAAEAALRALRHPRCTPLELPPDQYEQWKTIRFNFDPRDML